MKHLLCVLLVLFSATSAADETSQLPSSVAQKSTGYLLTIDEKGAGSEQLLRGDYYAAIAAAESAQRFENSAQALSAQQTLCVAYIRVSALDEAAAACDKAVSLARAPITTLRNPHGHVNRDALAKAHINRGVLLAILGDTETASADFGVALRQNRQSDVVRHNMRLSSAQTTAARGD